MDCAYRERGVRAEILRGHGGVLIELAILIPLVLLLIGGIVDLSSVIRESNVLIEASRHGARSGGGSAAQAPVPSYWCQPGPVSYHVACSEVTGFGADDRAIEDAVARACEYIELTLGERAGWEVSAEKRLIADEDPILGLDDNRFIELAVTVRQSPEAPARCLFCTIPLFREMVLEGASSFALQVRCGGTP